MPPSSPTPTLTTPLTHLLSITHPILLAGMAHTSTTPLAAAVSLSGGLGVIGGLGRLSFPSPFTHFRTL